MVYKPQSSLNEWFYMCIYIWGEKHRERQREKTIMHIWIASFKRERDGDREDLS